MQGEGQSARGAVTVVYGEGRDNTGEFSVGVKFPGSGSAKRYCSSCQGMVKAKNSMDLPRRHGPGQSLDAGVLKIQGLKAPAVAVTGHIDDPATIFGLTACGRGLENGQQGCGEKVMSKMVSLFDYVCQDFGTRVSLPLDDFSLARMFVVHLRERDERGDLGPGNTYLPLRFAPVFSQRERGGHDLKATPQSKIRFAQCGPTITRLQWL